MLWAWIESCKCWGKSLDREYWQNIPVCLQVQRKKCIPCIELFHLTMIARVGGISSRNPLDQCIYSIQTSIKESGQNLDIEVEQPASYGLLRDWLIILIFPLQKSYISEEIFPISGRNQSEAFWGRQICVLILYFKVNFAIVITVSTFLGHNPPSQLDICRLQ